MGHPSQNLVAQRVKQARKAARLTQSELSAKLAKAGVSIDRAGIAKIEAGIRGVLDFELVGLSKALDVTMTWLVGIQE